MVSRRMIMLSALVSASVVLTFLFLYNPFNGDQNHSPTSFNQVDLSAFNWSGQNEGETANVQPENSGSVRGMNIPLSRRYSLATGLEEIAKKLGGKPLIPTLLPEGMIYSDVYMPPGDICFSYNKTLTPTDADIVIETSRPYIIPSLEDQQHVPSNLTGVRMVQAGEIWVSISDRYFNDPETNSSWAEGYFFHESFYYAISIKYPLTNQDLTTIIGSMRTPT